MTLSPHTGGVPDLPQPHGPRPPLRASDADRDAVVRSLRDATARGMLTLDECGERMAAAYGARFQHDLPLLTADLPPASAPAPVVPGWRAVTVLALLQARASLAAMPGGAVLRSRAGAAAALALLAVLPVLGVLEAGDALGLELLDD